jgi:Membrane bound FAD containing D-sorbitol dehydrogenase
MTNSPRDTQFPLFFSLSKYLTGESGLDRALAEAHLKRLRSVSNLATLAKLLAQWQAAQKNPAQTERMIKKILADPILGPLAKTLIMLWYTGGIKNPDDGTWVIETAADYFNALSWKVAGSHPPGLSNQFFGHWKYPTEY